MCSCGAAYATTSSERPAASSIYALWHRLRGFLGRPASESGSLRYGDGATDGAIGDRDDTRAVTARLPAFTRRSIAGLAPQHPPSSPPKTPAVARLSRRVSRSPREKPKVGRGRHPLRKIAPGSRKNLAVRSMALASGVDARRCGERTGCVVLPDAGRVADKETTGSRLKSARHTWACNSSGRTRVARSSEPVQLE